MHLAVPAVRGSRCAGLLPDLVAAFDSVLDLYSYYTDDYFVIVDPLGDITEFNESNNEKCSGTTCFFPPDPDICSNW